MRIFTAYQVAQGTPEWFELRRGLPTASGVARVLTPTGKPSAQAEDYGAELAADVAELQPNFFQHGHNNKPPNHAMMNGVATEPEARRWFEMEHDCNILQVGGILSDCGRFWCSPDGLVLSDAGTLSAGLELKCPYLKTQAGYVLRGTLPTEYRPQVHGSLVIAGDLPRWHFLSYASGLPALDLVVEADEYTAKLREAMEAFWGLYEGVLKRLGLMNRFNDQRASTLSHYPEDRPCSPSNPTED